MPQPDFLAQWDIYKTRADAALKSALPNDSSRLSQAMRYSCLQGGKRFRAMLVYASAAVFRVPLARVDKVAAAIEMVHAYSLIHDDLPAMDDDALRRGKASCHIKFDQATAILAGDALQSLAFAQLCQPQSGLSASGQLAMVKLLAEACGHAGMVGGQSLDVQATATVLDLAQLQVIHEHKTGALIRAAIGLGLYGCAAVAAEDRKALDNYGKALGLAFQVVDDVLDATQSSEILGKISGADAQMQKNTYPCLCGIEQARLFAEKLRLTALQSLDKLTHNSDNITFLRQLANYTISREY